MPDQKTVPCKWCECETSFTSTKECNRCWELHHRIEIDLELAKRMIRTMEGKRESRIEMTDRILKEAAYKKMKGGD